MTEQEVIDIVNGTGCFKNTTVNFNEEKEICDIYTRCTIPQDEFLEKVQTIKTIQVVACDFGIFELIIPLNELETTIKEFQKVFSI